MLLWSDWDVALHHRRRYSKQSLLKLVTRPGVDVMRCAYFNAAMLPAILGVRMLRKVVPPKPGGKRAEDWLPGNMTNGLLRQLLVRPAQWKWFHPPFGVSLLAVLRRKAP